MISLPQLTLLGSNLAKLGPKRLAIMATVGMAVTAAVGVAGYFLSRPALQPIYTGLTPQDVTRMTGALAEAGVPFDVSEQRNAVLVPFGQAAKARTLLAQKGLPTSSRAGYELFDQLGTMGLTSFMQEVTRVRALEGEIARTIQALDGVSAARVHLVLPEAGSFRREPREPSASVLLRIDARWQSAAGQVVRHIVAAAVPGMKVEQVSVASTDGRLIASGGDDTKQGSHKLAELERSMATEIEQRAAKTLASALGAGNYQISASVRLDIDRQQINETVFDPKSRVERSVRIVKQSGSSEDGGRPAVSVDANIPREENASAGGDKRQQREDRREEQVSYELNSKSVQTVREGYRVQRLAIAAVVNQKQLVAQLGGNADTAAINARLAELRRLIAAAAGTSSDRDDLIEVSAVAFEGNDQGVAPSGGLAEQAVMHLGSVVNALAMLALVFIVLKFGLRPLMTLVDRQVASSAPGGALLAGPASGGTHRPPSSGDNRALAGSESSGPGGIGILAKPRDVVIRERLEELVAQNEAKVAQVLKGWMSEASSS